MTRIYCMAVCCLGLMAYVGAAESGKPLSLNRLNEKTADTEVGAVSTLTWPVSFPGAPLRVLFVAPEYGWGDGMGLVRRFGFKIDAITPETWALEWSGGAVALTGYDLLLWAAPDTIPDLDDVPISTVSIGYGGDAPYLPPPGATPVEDPVFWRGLPYDALRGAGYPPTLISAGEREGRRVAAAAFDAPPPDTQVLVPSQLDPAFTSAVYEEFAFGLIARLVLWATAYAPENVILAIEDAAPTGPDETEIPPQLPKEYVQTMRDSILKTAMHPFELVLNGESENRYYLDIALHYPNRDIQRRIEMTGSTPHGAASFPFQIPVGRGTYFLTVRLLDRNRVVDWFTRECVTEEWPQLDAFTCDVDAINPYDTINLGFKVQPRFNDMRGATVYARAIDPLNRVIAEHYEAIPPEGASAIVSLDVTDLICSTLRVEVFAADVATGPIDPYTMERSAYRFVDLPVRQTTRPPFAIIAGGRGGAEPRSRRLNTVLRDAGVNTMTLPPDIPPTFGAWRDGLRDIPRIAVRASSRANESPAVIRDTLIDTAASFAPYGATAFMLEDIHPAPGQGPVLGPHRGAGFDTWRAMAEGRFDPAHPDAPEPEDDAPLKARFAEWSAVTTYEDARDAVRNGVLAASLGPPPPPAALHDQRDWWNAYTRTEVAQIPVDAPGLLERARCYTSPTTFGGLYVAPRGEEAGRANVWARWTPWESALHGLGGVWLAEPFPWRGQPSQSFVTQADTMTEEAATLIAAAAPLTRGLGAIFAEGAWHNSGIAFYDNQTTRLWSTARDPDSREAAEREHAMQRAVNRLGYQYDMVSPELVEAGALKPFRAVILAGVGTLGAREVAALAEFAGAGGAVLADGPWPRPEGDAPSALDELAKAGVTVITLADEIPEGAYDESRLAAVGAALEGAGATPVCPGGAEPMPFEGEWFRYTYDEATVLAYLRNAEGNRGHERVRFRGDENTHYYDALAGLYLGDKPRVTQRLGAGEVMVLTALPYEITALELHAPESIPAGQRLEFTVTIKTAPRLPGRHPVAVSLEPRYGQSIPYYTRVCDGQRGSAAGMISLARNELIGWYTLKARDLLTGLEIEQYLEITPPFAPQ